MTKLLTKFKRLSLIFVSYSSIFIPLLIFLAPINAQLALQPIQNKPLQKGPEAASMSRAQAVTSTGGMVVSDDRIASEWGAEILRRGGNAIDAAVATAFALAVTRPHYASLGGGGFMLYCPAPQPKTQTQCHIIDYREEAPEKAYAEMFVQNQKANPLLAQNGPLASGTPGAVAGLLEALEKFGTFPRQKLLARPIQLAKNGYPFTTHEERAALERWSAMNDAGKKIFGCKANSDESIIPCPPGTQIRQTDLARVLSEISKKGKKGFYEGWVAQKLTQGIKSAGGILSLTDLKNYKPKTRIPVEGKFQDWKIITIPPPSSGGAIILQLFAYASQAQTQGAFQEGVNSTKSIHALAHSMALAFADRSQHFGDPDFFKNPLQELLNPSYLQRNWKSYNPEHIHLPLSAGAVGESPIPEGQHTTHFSVMDRYGNAVAITTTVNDNFGSAFVPPQTGIVMNNEMDDFSIQPGTPNLFGLVGSTANSIAPHKRPLSSMSPTIIQDNRQNNKLIIGAAGGPRIITSVFLTLFNHLYFGMPLPDAIAAARFHHQWKPDSLFMEKFGFPFEVTSHLQKIGYTITDVTRIGMVQALEVLPNGRTLGAPDPRGEGAAVGERKP